MRSGYGQRFVPVWCWCEHGLAGFARRSAWALLLTDDGPWQRGELSSVDSIECRRDLCVAAWLTVNVRPVRRPFAGDSPCHLLKILFEFAIV